MKELKNWTEISKGYFRFVIGANVAYEIIVEFWSKDTPIETAKESFDVTMLPEGRGFWWNPVRISV